MSEPLNTMGGGAAVDLRFVTAGKLRKRIDSLEPIEHHEIVTNEPNAGRGEPMTFFRIVNGKQQFCVRFASGVTQVVTTEPD